VFLNFEVSATTASSDRTLRDTAPSRRCPDRASASLMPAPRVTAASTCHPCNRPRIAFAHHAQELIFPFCISQLPCYYLPLPCDALPCLTVLLAGLQHAAARLLCCMPPKLPKPPRLLLSAPTSSSTACNWSCAVLELSVRPRARACYHHHTSHPCVGPNRVELVHRDPGAASPAPPSSSQCCPSVSPSDVAPNHGPECHVESSPCSACCLLRRKSASTPTARLRPSPPLLRPP
jgi:hypothetical protein